MKIVNVGYNYRHPADFCINRPHGSGDYVLLIVKSEAFVFLGGEKINISPNSAVVFKKGTAQHFGAKNGEYVNDWIHFELENEEESRLSELGIPFDRVITLHDSGVVSGFIKGIFAERYSGNIHKDISMNRYFDLILFKLSEQLQGRSSEDEHPYYHAFCVLKNEIHTFPNTGWCIDLISKKMNLSRSYVQHLYKRFFGVGILSDIRNSRMEQAKYLLSSTNVTVAAISRLCGYETDVHFMRVFKKNTGFTPSQFRTDNRISASELRKSKSDPPFSMQD